uniref:Uncharacterized protein n=1 Tax=Arundo donax TaxID=35708 RepID=A0A0A9FQ77_ARUDO
MILHYSLSSIMSRDFMNIWPIHM